LGELAQRITNILAELTPAEEERYAADLMEVERTLKAAHRRLQRSVAVR
jgi:ABC-type Zn2+ transport system substrate-binding protein/surface adhesin